MSDTKKYPLGVQSFPKIINGKILYVDKTEFVYRLVKENQYYFLSRPRRFGKSLLLSTLETFFLGKREMFKGLAIDRHEDLEWLEHPVLHLDFNIQDYADDDNSLPEVLDDALCEWEERFNVTARGSFSLRFRRVIMSAYRQTGRKVVILVDEYDRPLTQNLKEESLARQERFRNLLKGSFGILKSCDEYIKFAFLSGVTKFGRVSVFSDLNNLRDISLLSEYNDICGISESELTENFKYGIKSA